MDDIFLDVCKDSSDESESSERTEGFATMEFFEYEVHTSSDDEGITESDDDSNYSSSGSDVSYNIFHKTKSIV